MSNCCDEVRGATCHCAACHRTFGSLVLFDRHQDINYGRDPVVFCKSPYDLGLIRDASGVWRTPEAVSAITEKVSAMRAGRVNLR
jgi:hypothetical protein